MTKRLLKTFAFFIVIILIYKPNFAQHAYIGGGYNISYSRLKGLNLFIDAYNEDPNKTNGWVFDKPMDNLHFITGPCFSASFEKEDFLFDMTWVRRQASTYANYEIPSHTERWIRYKAGTLGFGVSKKMRSLGSVSMYPGIAVDFSKMKVQTYLITDGEDAWKDAGVSGNFGFNFSCNFMYKPYSSIPLVFSIKPYYEMNLFKLDCSPLTTEMPGNYTGDMEELKLSGGNIGIMFQVMLDIFAVKDVKLPERKPKPEIVVEVKQNPVIKGNVRDIVTGQPLDAVLTFYIDNKPVASLVTENGSYILNPASYANYTVEAKAFGYQTKSSTVEVNPNSENPLLFNIKLAKVPSGQAVKLENILFEKSSDKLLEESFAELNKLVKFMSINLSVEIEVAGHTSSDGNDDYNLKLSQDRAQSVSNYLISKGISASRIISKGYGETKPIASNDTEDGKKLNRRVEFKILKQ